MVADLCGHLPEKIGLFRAGSKLLIVIHVYLAVCKRAAAKNALIVLRVVLRIFFCAVAVSFRDAFWLHGNIMI